MQTRLSLKLLNYYSPWPLDRGEHRLTGLLPEDEDDDEDEGAYNRVGRRQRRYKRDVTDDEAASCTNCGVQTGLHIVYKRQDHGEHAGDYGK